MPWGRPDVFRSQDQADISRTTLAQVVANSKKKIESELRG